MVSRGMQNEGWVPSGARIAAALVLILSGTPLMPARGQAAVMTSAESRAWLVWAFARLGGASSAPVAVATSGGGVLTSVAGGIVASHGALLGMVRATDSEQFFVGPGERDNALLIGLRSLDHHFFATGAVGIARATAFQTSDGGGTSTGNRQTAFAYDVSGHGVFRAAGLALTIAGVVGPQKTSYVAVTLGAEIGWFGR